MKLRQEQVDKLREGKATLVADHSKPEMMEKVLKEAFPKDSDTFLKYKDVYYLASYKDKLKWGTETSKDSIIGELIHLVDFFEEEDTLGIDYTNKAFDGLTVYREPKTPEERDKMVKDLQAINFTKELPSELDDLKVYTTDSENSLVKLLRMRDIYRDGLISKENDNYSIELRSNKEFKIYHYDCKTFSSSFSFQDKETAELFLNNFKEELEQVKHLIS